MTFISLYTILERKEYLAKMNNLPKHHGAGSCIGLRPTLLRVIILQGCAAFSLLPAALHLFL